MSKHHRIAAVTVTVAVLGAGATPAIANSAAAKTPPSVHGARSAAAHAIRNHVARSLDSLTGGQIWSERDTYSGPGTKGGPFTITTVAGEPANGGAPASLWSTSDGLASNGRRYRNVTGIAYQGGDEEVYSSESDTVYESSIWAPYLHPGSQAGTFVYRAAEAAPYHSTQPIPVTANQAAGLRNGTQAITATATVGQWAIGPVQPLTVAAQNIVQNIQSGDMHAAGTTTLNGATVVEYTTPAEEGQRATTVYLDPATNLPVEQIIAPGTSDEQVITMKVSEMPANATSEKQLELTSLHPDAKMDSDHTDYANVAGGLSVYPQ